MKQIWFDIERCYLTTGTSAAILFVPETMNAKKMATTGDYNEFMLTWAATLDSMRAAGSTVLPMDFPGIVDTFYGSSGEGGGACRPFDDIVAAVTDFSDDAELGQSMKAAKREYHRRLAGAKSAAERSEIDREIETALAACFKSLGRAGAGGSDDGDSMAHGPSGV